MTTNGMCGVPHSSQVLDSDWIPSPLLPVPCWSSHCLLSLQWRSEVKVAQVYQTSWDPTDWLYSPWNSLGQNTGVGSLFLLQRIFPTQRSHPGLPHCRRILRWEAPNFTNHNVFRQCFSTQAAELPNDQTPTSNLGTIKSESRNGIFSASSQWFQWAAQAKDTIFIGNFCFPFLLGKLHKRIVWLHHRGPASWVGRICSTHFGFNEILPVKLSNWGVCVCVCVFVCVWQPTSVALMKSFLWSYLSVCVCERERETTNQLWTSQEVGLCSARLTPQRHLWLGKYSPKG